MSCSFANLLHVTAAAFVRRLHRDSIDTRRALLYNKIVYKEFRARNGRYPKTEPARTTGRGHSERTASHMETALSGAVLPKPARTPLTALFLLLSAGGFALLFLVDPSRTPLVPCLFRTLTGLDCPGCGMTRAFHALLHFQLLRALRFNVFCIVVAPALLLLWAELLSFFSRGRFFRMPLRIPTAVLIGFGILVLAFTVLRNIPAAPFCWLKV